MGLGDQIANLLGLNQGKTQTAEGSGLFYQGVKGAILAGRKIMGRTEPMPMENEISQKVADGMNLLFFPSGLSGADTAVRLEQQRQTDTGIYSEETADLLLSAIQGRVAELQLENIAGIKIDSSMPVTNALMGQMGAITDVSLAAAAGSIVAEIASVGQIDTVGQEIRSYMDYSGLSQITGFGYGMILNSALGVNVTQEINQKMQAYALDPTVLVNARMREYITDNYYYAQMARNGFSHEKAEIFLKTNRFWPNPQDFIRMAVRDAFNPTLVQQGGLDEQFPSAIVPYADKAGMSEEILKWYWRAHWELPSPQMGFEMLHRKLINQGQLKSLLKAADYAPGYIDAMIGISYSSYTRVDARRMWQTGVLSDSEFVEAMEEIGYNTDKAQKLLQWLKSDGGDGDKDLSQSMIVNAFKIGLMDRQTALRYLQDMGYDPKESDVILKLEEEKDRQRTIEEGINVAIFKLSRERISEQEFTATLGKMGIPEKKAEYYKVKAELQRERRTKLPSKEDTLRWFGLGMISEAQARTYLKRMGYRKDEENLYIEEAKE
jgi:hypothetical protein